LEETLPCPQLVMAVTAVKDTVVTVHHLHRAVLNGVKAHHHLLPVDMVDQDTEVNRPTPHMVDLTAIMDRRQGRREDRRPVGISSPEETIDGRNS
jgi:hypothetical protein